MFCVVVEQLKKTSLKSEDRISKLESRLSIGNNAPAQAGPAAAAANNNKSDDDDGVDLFGSDSEDEDEAAAKLREQRLAEYAAKKSKSKFPNSVDPNVALKFLFYHRTCAHRKVKRYFGCEAMGRRD